MKKRRRDIFTTIRTEGNLLPVDLLQRVAEGDKGLDGLSPEAYHIGENERLNEVINRAWKRCKTTWAAFRKEYRNLPDSDAGTTLTRERWLLVLFQELAYGRLLTSRAKEIDGKTYPISHFWNRTPIHLVSFRHNLDRRTPGVAGAARLSPHGLVQEFLNRSQDHLWGIVSNGLSLRLLRDNASLTRQAYVEFDLEGMMSGEVYSDFILLFLLLHQSRVEAEKPEQCWLEQWTRKAQEQGTRALDQLRRGVEEAIKSLGKGFLAHAGNAEIREKLRKGEMDAHELYQQLLRLIYRLIFLFVAEDRNLLLLPEAKEEVKRRYLNHYSLNRVRRMAGRVRGTRHADLWEGLRVTFRCLYQGESALGIDPLGGFLFSPDAIPDLNHAGLSNESLLEAIRHLSYTREGRALRPVDYRNLGTEELGSVYESLLELHPEVNTAAATFDLRVAAGSDRKTTGSYYTPSSLISCLLDSALEPVIEGRLKEAKRLANGEWRTEEEKHYAYSVVSGTGCLAEKHELGRAGIWTNEEIPERRAIRPDVSNSPGSELDSGKYSGGLGASGQSRVPAVPADRPGQSQRTGNAFDSQSAGGDLHCRPASPSFSGNYDSVQTTFEPHSQSQTPQHLKKVWSQTPLATRHSLLAAQALLNLRLVDPACGSGHFLIAAAHRMAKHLAMIRTGEGEPGPEERRKAIRDVVSHCIYGVDLNPLAVELCKVALWIETLDPGKPLGFLDHHIKCGNSLIGATPELLEKGIPDNAFKPVEGDEKQVATTIRRKNRNERKWKEKNLFAGQAAAPGLDETIEEIREWGFMPEDNQQAVSDKANLYHTLMDDPGIRHAKEVADLWTAAFFWPLTDASAASVPTEDRFRRFQEGSLELPDPMRRRMESLARRHRFFHWHLEFPEVFSAPHSLSGSVPNSLPQSGFDCVLGNPPWERIKLQEKEFFAQRDPEIANAPNAAARKKLISRLPEENPALWEDFHEAKRNAEAESHYMRASNRYPLSAVGDINTYQIFAGLDRELASDKGRAGIVIPSGIATDDSNKRFFADLTEKKSLISLYDFENREAIFPGVHRSYKFCLLTIGGPGAAPGGADFAFFLTNTSQLREEDRHFSLSAEDIALLNPNTRTCPIFRSKRDAEITKAIYRRVPVLIDESKGEEGNPWGITFLRMFDMANDSHLFRTREELEGDGWKLEGNVFVKGEERYLPLYEGKMMHLYNHRAADVEVNDKNILRKGQGSRLSTEDLKNPFRLPIPHYWVDQISVLRALKADHSRFEFIAYKGVSSPTNERTFMGALLPLVAIHHNAPIILSMNSYSNAQYLILLANLNSFVFDYLLRNKANTTYLSFFYLCQIPVLTEKSYSLINFERKEDGTSEWIALRVMELCCTAVDLTPFARKVWKDLIKEASKISNFPGLLIWNDARRFLIRCELDAIFFHLYGINRDDVDYIMETFPIVKRKDEQKYGEYRTKRVILECYDAMTEAIQTGKPYQTILDPPPADPSVAHPPTNSKEWKESHCKNPYRTRGI